jgi:hypothetical protein
MKCKQCGAHYAWYQDVDGFCSAECAVAWETESRNQAERVGKIIWFFLKLIAMSFPYIALAVFGLRHIFPEISDSFSGWGMFWSIVIFSVIYGGLILLSWWFSGEKWADVMRSVLGWVKRVGIIFTVIILIFDLFVIPHIFKSDFNILSFLLGK